MVAFAWSSLWMAFVYTTLYAIVSRLPMIFAMVYMVYELKLEGATPALVFCGYCIARLLSAVGTVRYFGMPAMFLGTSSGVLGYAGILIWPTNGILFGIMIGLTGFTETVTGIDTFLKIECLIEDYPLDTQQLLFRVHLVGATLGSFIAYLGGGVIYETAGVTAICLFGTGVSVLNMAVLAVYCLQRRILCRHFFLYADDVLQEIEVDERNFIWQLNPELAAKAEGGRTSAKSCMRMASRATLGSRGTLASRITVSSTGTSIAPSTCTSIVPVSTKEASRTAWAEAAGGGGEDGDIWAGRPSQMLPEMELPMSARQLLRSQSSCASSLSMLDWLLYEVDKRGVENLNSTPSISKARGSLFRRRPGSSMKLMRRNSTRDMGTFLMMDDDEQRKIKLSMLALVLSFYVTVLPISNNFGVLALYWQAQWNKGTSVSGLIMAAGELGGLLALQVLANKRVFRLQILRPFRKPMNLIMATLVASLAVALVTVPVIHLSAVGSVGVHVANVLLHSFCSECAAAWSPHDVYAFWIGRCYLSKRLSNATVAAATINLFFMEPLWPPRPYVFVASVVSAWGFVLFGVFFYLGLLPWQQDQQNQEDQARVSLSSSSSSISPRADEVTAVSIPSPSSFSSPTPPGADEVTAVSIPSSSSSSSPSNSPRADSLADEDVQA